MVRASDSLLRCHGEASAHSRTSGKRKIARRDVSKSLEEGKLPKELED